MTFDEQLNAYIALLGCTAKELSDASGLSPSVISRYRTGIPEEIIPQPAVVKVNDLYPQACIVKAEYDDGDLELELDNGMELKFDKRLNMIGLDR